MLDQPGRARGEVGQDTGAEPRALRQAAIARLRADHRLATDRSCAIW